MAKLKKILIVDDEPDVIAYLTSLFEDNGFAAITAVDGKEGFAKVKSEKPDLITLDISMPEESGVKMYRDLQNDKDLSKIPVVVVTGLSPDFKRFIERRKQVNPPAAYFEKPIDKKELLSKVKELLGI